MAASFASANVRDDQATGSAVYSRESVSTHELLVRSGDTMLYADSPSHQQEILSGFAGFDFWRDGRNEALLIDPSSVFVNGMNLPGQGLSLCLGTRVHSGIQVPLTDPGRPILGLASFLGSNPVIDESTVIVPPGFGSLGCERDLLMSRYLKAVQQLLDEVVNVRKASSRPPNESNDKNTTKILKQGDEGGSKDDPATHVKESADRSSELSNEERQELQDKLSRLISMSDEVKARVQIALITRSIVTFFRFLQVDKRYNQYHHQMQIVKQSFDAMAGSGASKPYTVLALRRISHQFRCLRDAIAGQITATRKRLGEEDSVPGTSISRLRCIDQRLMQRRMVHQLGMMQQDTWRPQRGLPESSVSALRAWLFEHFLHPYPKDSDKALLVRQTGLTRGQISNWFINARVRLWKPMVEQIYKEEMGGLELELDSLSENIEQAACSEECPVRELDAVIAEERADAENTEHHTGRVRNAVSLSLGSPLPEARHFSMVAMGSDSFYDTQLSSAAAETNSSRQQKHKPR